MHVPLIYQKLFCFSNAPMQVTPLPSLSFSELWPNPSSLRHSTAKCHLPIYPEASPDAASRMPRMPATDEGHHRCTVSSRRPWTAEPLRLWSSFTLTMKKSCSTRIVHGRTPSHPWPHSPPKLPSTTPHWIGGTTRPSPILSERQTPLTSLRKGEKRGRRASQKDLRPSIRVSARLWQHRLFVWYLAPTLHTLVIAKL